VTLCLVNFESGLNTVGSQVKAVETHSILLMALTQGETVPTVSRLKGSDYFWKMKIMSIVSTRTRKNFGSIKKSTRNIRFGDVHA